MVVMAEVEAAAAVSKAIPTPEEHMLILPSLNTSDNFELSSLFVSYRASVYDQNDIFYEGIEASIAQC